MTKNWDKSTLAVLLAAALIYAAYIPAALWSRHTYVPAPAPPGEATPLFRMDHVAGFAFRSPAEYLFLPLADDKPDAQRSPVQLYENDKPLGPPHSQIADIEHLGEGRYAHRRGKGLIFSTSDNSDPNNNGRHYWVVLPKP
jgi:hypothetical protein